MSVKLLCCVVFLSHKHRGGQDNAETVFLLTAAFQSGANDADENLLPYWSDQQYRMIQKPVLQGAHLYLPHETVIRNFLDVNLYFQYF